MKEMLQLIKKYKRTVRLLWQLYASKLDYLEDMDKPWKRTYQDYIMKKYESSNEISSEWHETESIIRNILKSLIYQWILPNI